MTNKRIYFATQAVNVKPDGAATNSWTPIRGLQKFDKTTTFSTEQVYQMGMLPIYANIEGVPNVELSMSRVLDGNPLLWTLMTQNATAPTLANRGDTKCLFGLSVYPDTNTAANGIGGSECEISGVSATSLTYNFNIDGNFTEDVNGQGTDVVWANDVEMVQTAGLWSGANSLNITNSFTGTEQPIGSGGINRKQHFVWDYSPSFGIDSNGQMADPDASTIPPEVDGISSSGTNEKVGGIYRSSVQSISLSANITREDINQLGLFGPAARTIKFPVEVTTQISVIGGSGDMKSATQRGIYTPDGSGQCGNLGNTKNRTIRVATCEGTRIYTGTRNRLTSVGYTGGEAGGGNVTLNYNYVTYNDFTVIHSADPNPSGATWWTNRADYLNDN